MNSETYETNEPRKGFSFPTGGRELFLLILMALSGLGMCNSLLFGGANLGFAIFTVLMLLFTGIYLLISGVKPTFYSLLVVILCIVIAAAFGRSNDNLVKFIMAVFLFFGVNIGLCLMARQNLWQGGTFRTLADAPVCLGRMGFGKLPHAIGGLFAASRRSGGLWRKGGAFILGLCVAIPLVAVVISLLTSADAAFSGLLDILPELDFWEMFLTLFLGIPFVLLFYTRGVALRHTQRKEPKAPRSCNLLSPITVNTVLCAVSAVYVLYLVSQLAYFVGGFSGILPKEYTMAEYARRGFFEMAVLCGINLALTALSTFLVRKYGRINLLTKLLCLFIGLVTLFLVCTASAKMFLYIGSFGPTRMRVLTQIVTLFLALVDLVAMVWLFAPKLPYMKFVVVAALLIGAVTIWVDVDTVVAHYNTNAYLSGRMEEIDVTYLRDLNHAAVPYLAKLAEEAPDETEADQAMFYLRHMRVETEDFRDWNYATGLAKKFLPVPGEAADVVTGELSPSVQEAQ